MRDRVYGLETEYAVLYRPSQEGGHSPSAREIYEILEDILTHRYKTLQASHYKIGVFLENGGLIHFEGSAQHHVHGLVEASTPECSTAREATVYHQAMTSILQGLEQDLNARLKLAGYTGSVVFGKNNTDNKGNFYGTHENYYVDDTPAAPRWVMTAGVLAFLALFKPLDLLLMTWLPLVFVRSLLILALLAYVVLKCLAVIPGLTRPVSRLLDRTHDRGEMLFGFCERLVLRLAHLYHFLTSPLIRLYSHFLKRTLLARATRYLAPYFVTRSIWCGAGRLTLGRPDPAAPPGSPFQIMQRSEVIGDIARICWDDARRPIIDLKNFVLEPFSPLQRYKRMHIIYSDSNMSETATYLKLGVTGLLLEMVEDGCPLSDLNFARPLEAVGAISGDTSLRRTFALANGQSVTALQIQRHYLEEAQKFFSQPEHRSDAADDILVRWEYVLNCLEANPQLLYRELDWIAKRDLILQALKGTSLDQMQDIAIWAESLRTSDVRLDLMADWPETDIHQTLERAVGADQSARLRDYIEYHELTWKHMVGLLLKYFQIQKIDLKFHELSVDEGYFLRLARAGMVTRIVTDEEIEQARTTPPAHTRASIRGELIRRYAEQGKTGANIGWSEFRPGSRRRTVRFPDPLQSHLDESLLSS